MDHVPHVIFEDEYLFVIAKPAGMVVNRADTTKDVVTVQDWVERKYLITNVKPDSIGFKYPISNEGSDFVKRAGIVHRLDKETSGALVIAKDEESFSALQRQFKEGTVEKAYIALVHGKVIPEKGEIKLPIGRLPWNRMRFGVFPGGRQAHTEYQVLRIMYYVSNTGNEELSLIKVFPKTGRTHQIRVHFQYQGHPLFADELYAGRRVGREDRKKLGRHFLHAAEISFTHPKSGEHIHIEAPLPPDLQGFLDTLS